jgi:hypothetical protein
MLGDLQPNLRTPVYHHKVFLMMQEIVFMCVVSISIDWLFCNLYLSLLQSTVPILGPLQIANAVLSHPVRIRYICHLSLRSNRSEPHAEIFRGSRRESRRRGCAGE